MKKYKAYKSFFDTLIQEVEITRETESCIFKIDWNGKERKEKKVSSYINYFDTYQEAKDFIVNNIEKEIGRINLQLKLLNKNLSQAKSL